ncbi:MAG: TIGR04442 family protein [Trichlorobacter sp.]|uniref:TIGR04442 family protein n=1 Tax=Trichlorobacter sp. TaxID=2911007 RepID=UPI00255E4C43|nr:TIGR04442 family protein [Trichlorobacter sp.]MDK9717523.1 TIGR04442 family protein [Trichlorobacter sp.]
MQKDIRLHGQLANGIEYFVLVVGTEAYQRYFFNIVQEEDELRIFSPGNEFILGQKGISFEGNGGHFCEYMFGVEQPTSDLTKTEIINRLVMNGACLEEESGALHFSEQTSGHQSYDTVFFEGNAVCNYFFSVHSPRLSRKLGEQQQELVRLLGKGLKRTPAVGEERDDLLVDELFPLLQDEGAQLFIVKLINTHHKAYRDLFRSLYFRSKKIADDDFARLTSLASARQIDRYQQERMRIDVMYRHPMNRRIVDEYRSILIGCTARGEISTFENARLNRLKALSVRNKIPGALFFTLDELLKKGRDLKEADEEADYIAQTRQILEGFFLHQSEIDSSIDRDDMLILIKAKKWAIAARDHHFDHLMLDFSRECDEKIRDGADPALLEGFSYVITYLDRLDSTLSLIGQLAFMENVRITEEMLQGLLEHRAAFENLQPGCFEELFAKELFDNPYLGRFGRMKMTVLMEGLPLVQAEQQAIEDLHTRLIAVDQEERLYLMVLELVRHRVRNFYSSYGTKAEQDVLRREVLEELKARKKLAVNLPDHVFQETVTTIQKEAVYLQSLLPTIIAEKNAVLREDFLANAGLDRFYVEELEREYYEQNGLDLEEMYQIRQGL